MPNASIITNKSRAFSIGTYAGTGAAQSINIGFKPCALLTWNLTDGDDVNLWISAEQMKFVNIALAAANITAIVAPVDNGTEIGFSLPADSDINENLKTYGFIAFYG